MKFLLLALGCAAALLAVACAPIPSNATENTNTTTNTTTPTPTTTTTTTTIPIPTNTTQLQPSTAPTRFHIDHLPNHYPTLGPNQTRHHIYNTQGYADNQRKQHDLLILELAEIFAIVFGAVVLGLLFLAYVCRMSIFYLIYECLLRHGKWRWFSRYSRWLHGVEKKNESRRYRAAEDGEGILEEEFYDEPPSSVIS